MEYVEKVKWEKGEGSTHTYNILEKVLESMREHNPMLSIASSELYDENGKLIATYKKGEGVKMVEEIEEIEVSARTFEFMEGKDNYFKLYDKWQKSGDAILDNALYELNNTYINGVTALFEELIKGKAKLVKKEKNYRVILKGLHRFDNVQAYSEYVYLQPDGTIAKTKSFAYIAIMSEKSMKKLPEWAQALAEEVE